jgi:hypothetical protein
MEPGWISAIAHAIVAGFNIYLFVKYVYRDPVAALQKKAEYNRFIAKKDRRDSLHSLVLVNAMPGFFVAIEELYQAGSSGNSAENKRLIIKSLCRRIRRSIEEPVRIVHSLDSARIKEALDLFSESAIAWLGQGQLDSARYEEQVSTLYSTIIRVVLEYDGTLHDSPHDWSKLQTV